MKCDNCKLPCRLLYTDRNGVSVNKYTLKVKKEAYPLKDIIKHKLSIIRPARLPGVLLLVMGAGLGLCSAITPVTRPEIIVAGNYFALNATILYLGLFFMALGIFRILFVRKRYALRIATQGGERNAVVSAKKEYILKLIHTLNDTFESNNYVHN